MCLQVILVGKLNLSDNMDGISRNDMKIIIDFFRFLRKQKAYHNYVLNILWLRAQIRQPSKGAFHDVFMRIYDTNKGRAETFVIGAFRWYETNEGVDYWNSMHIKWLQHMISIREKQTKIVSPERYG